MQLVEQSTAVVPWKHWFKGVVVVAKVVLFTLRVVLFGLTVVGEKIKGIVIINCKNKRFIFEILFKWKFNRSKISSLKV